MQTLSQKCITKHQIEKKLEKGIYIFLNKAPSLNCKNNILNVYPIFLEMFFIYLYYIVFLLLIMLYWLIDWLIIYVFIFTQTFLYCFPLNCSTDHPPQGIPGTQFENPWTSLHTTLTNVPPYRLNMQSVTKMIILHGLRELGIE